ncbi:DNA-binding response regulator, OmpR family, contains REC and winged-helix (wHTH) domain [Oceanobacillus limi]|uniref:DNA-binding response regulator, OmpR family, contains REC and winged-helix (WHTH) domain n=1 Tax=Oceanobacillus limi TaxID=930131 RepID=A0A1I0G276_9BACI|nr:response regulator transcription factor [Oceanobacillus limi]SET64788.1 DNA-binding response regulator, OmpR family, contains REC and winged-helix (wHTH) domain [Oceanobacillus limi]
MNESINILIIEDDQDINQLLCNIVRKNGYTPKPAYSGTEAEIYLEKDTWDMVLLDLMLPGLTGEEILKKITKDSTIPVIIISAKLETQTKIDTLRAGADDYITKPFDIEEVSARIESCLRRYRQMVHTPIIHKLQHKDIVMDTDAKKVSVSDKEIKLTAIEYEILLLLMSSPKKVFTKANLFESIWNEEFYGDDNTINVHLSNLRNKLSKANPDESYIETLWGMGYRLQS